MGVRTSERRTLIMSLSAILFTQRRSPQRASLCLIPQHRLSLSSIRRSDVRLNFEGLWQSVYSIFCK